jgi:hypothetical protein
MHTRSFLAGAAISAVFGLGCLVGRATGPASSAAATTYTDPPPGTPRWDYRCIRNESEGTGLGNDARELGKHGWELVAAAGAGWGQVPLNGSAFVLCFKRPL